MLPNLTENKPTHMIAVMLTAKTGTHTASYSELCMPDLWGGHVFNAQLYQEHGQHDICSLHRECRADGPWRCRASYPVAHEVRQGSNAGWHVG